MSNELNIQFEDEHLLVIDKPAGVLSQPGKTIDGSLATLVKDTYPTASGPMLVHRLDMDTSGLMVFAKDKAIHKHLQQQFEHRKVSKRYTAVLSKTPIGVGGQVLLPIRVDLDNRPTQIVCHDHGKHAQTLWRIDNSENAKPKVGRRVVFTPVTGRTHQLRVHAAHGLGLNAPIIGDRLYGEEADRMLLHASRLGFWHPVTAEFVLVESNVPF